MFDPELFGQAMGEAIKKAVAPLHEKIAALEKQLAQRPDVAVLVSSEVSKAVAAIPAAKDGKDCDMAAVKAMVNEAVKSIPVPKDGKDVDPEAVKALVREAVAALPMPQDGKSITVEDVRPMLDEAIKQLRADADEAIKEPLKLADAARDALCKAVGELRQPEDGKSVTLADVQPVIDAAIERIEKAAGTAAAKAEEAVARVDTAVAGLRQPADGRSVTVEDICPLITDAVKTIRDEALDRVELAVKALPAPKDGIGVAGAMIDRDGCLQITLSNGEVKALGVVVGKDGADLSEASFAYDGERTLTIEGKGGAVTKRLPIPLDKGYWRDGMSAEKGDIVTHDGNAWIALQDTRERPAHAAKGLWRVFARRGRDGESVVREVSTDPAKPIKLGA